ncbi:MAG TPA: ABC transporter permease [Verrucomicrobiae bacterium]|nr:ABC transporter permease [Verrucomicrobiae bacterium]
MTFWTLIFRSLRFHARAHLGVLLGAAVGSAALIGALVVGDSVRGSLRDLALARLGRVDTALAANDRLFRAKLADDIGATAPALQLPGIASSQDASARANHVQVLGVDSRFWQLANQPPSFTNLPADSVALNDALAGQLKAKIGDTILLRVQKPSLLSRDAPISPQQDTSVAMRMKVSAIVNDEQFGRFSLQANQVAPFNAFVNLSELQQQIAQPGRANLLLSTHDSNSVNQALSQHWQLADAELDLRELTNNSGVELRSSRIFIDPAVEAAARKVSSEAQPILTYLANDIRSGPFATPYSMVTAMGAPIVPADMRDNEILLNDWLANDLQAQPGDDITLRYYVIGNGRALEERTADFRVRGIIPLAGAAADRGLMPDFPGLAEAESTSDWDAGFPIEMKRIRPKDEQYWKQYRGTPKAFVTLAAGRKMWANRFGDCTAIRFPASAGSLETIHTALHQQLNPASVGLHFEPVRQQALAASSQAVDFGGLFIGFSFFLIVAALLLMGLLFQFGLEQRATEIGTLLALGFRPRQVRRLFLGEGVMLALAGGIIGALGGILYARAMLLGLTTIWRSAVGTSALRYHASPETLVMGIVAGTIVSALTIWLTLRRQARQPARELLAEGAAENYRFKSWKRSHGLWIGPVAALLAVITLWTAFAHQGSASADTFFSSGALLLIGGLGFAALWLAAAGAGNAEHFSMPGLAMRSCGRRRKRSLATIGLLACGVFLIVAIGAFRQDASHDEQQRISGTGGYELIGESSLPVTYDLNSKAGRDFYGLETTDMSFVRVLPFRVHDGDDASCLNLNRAQTPRLLGVNSDDLLKRSRFTFAQEIGGKSQSQGWLLLKPDANAKTNSAAADEIPAVGDENSILWAMGKKVGDTVDYTDEQGRPFKVRIVGALANSILQGSLIIDEAAFVERFPGESGYRMFLVNVPPNMASAVSAQMTRALKDQGLELTPTVARLNAFNAVQNTYLSTFQVLGGLGLLLGSAGLGVVVLRNVQERRGELGLLVAVGFRRGALQRLVLGEHGALLGLGLGVGLIAAVIAVLPALLSAGSQIPYASLAFTLAGVLLNGLIWTWVATRFALRGRLVDALRNE